LSAHVLCTQTLVYEEFLLVGISAIATLSGRHPLTPETQNLVLTQSLEATAISRHIFTPAPLETQYPIYIAPTMSTEGNHALAGENPAPPIPSNSEGALLGSLPKIFDSKRSDAKEFMRAFMR
jgi:hypothetical protein